MAARSPEARKVLRELDKELVQAGSRLGQALVWSAQETAILAQISSILDRKHDFLAAYEAAEDTPLRLKISAELRLLESTAARLVGQVKPDVPALVRESFSTKKARKAANARWERDATG